MTNHAQAVRCGVAVTALTAVLVAQGPPASASAWAVKFASSSNAQASAGPFPAPVGARAVCGTGKSIVVSWTAASHATSYKVVVSTNSGAYQTATTGVTGTTWTASALATGSYTYEVSAVDGNWTTVNSAATASHTISGSSCS